MELHAVCDGRSVWNSSCVGCPYHTAVGGVVFHPWVPASRIGIFSAVAPGEVPFSDLVLQYLSDSVAVKTVEIPKQHALWARFPCHISSPMQRADAKTCNDESDK